jgi:hypothetical protein
MPKKVLKINKQWRYPRTNPKLLISFSLYGNNPIYTHGAIDNVELANFVYPNWTCRFYVDDSVPKNIIEKLLELGAQVYTISPNKYLTKRQRSLWRFLPLGEVCRVIFRDADSRVNGKELYAVNEWRKTGKSFQLMWDNIDPEDGHGNPILAGMWGAVSNYKHNKKDEVEMEYNPYDHGLWDSKAKPLYPKIHDLIVNWKMEGYRSDENFLIKYIVPHMNSDTAHFMGCGIEPYPLEFIQHLGKNITFEFNEEGQKYDIKTNKDTNYDEVHKIVFSVKLKSTFIGEIINVKDKRYHKPNWKEEFINTQPNDMKDCGWEKYW